MSLSLAIAINAVFDVGLLAGLAWVMARARKLTPHVGAASGSNVVRMSAARACSAAQQDAERRAA